MDIDLDLEALDLKTIDLDGSNSSNGVSASTSGLDGLSVSSKPDLTISTSNDDLMPNMGSSDDLGDLGLSLLANKKKQKPESDEPSSDLGSSSTSTSQESGSSGGMFNSFFGGDKKPESTPEVMTSSFDSMKDIDLDKELNSLNLDSESKGMSGPGLPNLDSSSNSFGNSNTESSVTSNPYSSIPRTEGMSYEDIQKLNSTYYVNLKDLEIKVFVFLRTLV